MSCRSHTQIRLCVYDNLAFVSFGAQALVMASPASARRIVCVRCGASFDCGLSGDCWCAAEPYRLPTTKASIEDCLCPACLRKAATALAESRREAERGG
ncbi:MAG TPA: cysteine-rich CWC family protein [Pseudolabrys sp.]|jgi:hypothetical protein